MLKKSFVKFSKTLKTNNKSTQISLRKTFSIKKALVIKIFKTKKISTKINLQIATSKEQQKKTLFVIKLIKSLHSNKDNKLSINSIYCSCTNFIITFIFNNYKNNQNN